MKTTNHKGSELRNVSETWEENERKRKSGKAPQKEDAGIGNDLEQVVKEEAAAYDQENSEDKLLSGERASVNDDGEERRTEE